MQNKALALFSLFILLNCTSVQKSSRPLNDRLFPDGIYRQRIELEILKDGKPTSGFPFTSISRIEQGKFETIGLSPFGTSVFEASGDINKPENLKIKFFIKLPPFLKKSFIKKTFSKINSLYKLKETDLTKDDDRDYYKDETLIMEIFKYNSQSIPSVIRLKTKDWRVYVQTQSYKTLN